MLTTIANEIKHYIGRRVREVRTKQRTQAILRSKENIKLDIGSGPVKGKNGWTTLDLNDESDLYWDLLRPLPFPDDSIVGIYASHVFEHFYYADLMRLLKECFRVLKPGGTIEVCVPDASIYVKAYCNPSDFDRSFLVAKRAIISDEHMDIVNYIAYMNGHHRYMFDGSNLLRVLSEGGFAEVRRREFNPDLDLPERKYESLYAFGRKPK